jgi:hypothetical protein
MLRASRRKQKTMSPPANTTSLNSGSLDTSSFPSIYEDVFGDYSTAAQTGIPTNIAMPSVKDVLAAKSSSVAQVFDSDDHSPDHSSTNPNFVFSMSNVSHRSHSAWHPSLLTNQSPTTPNQGSTAPPSITLEDLASENSLRDCNYGELLEDPLSSFATKSSDKSTLTAQLGISPSNSLSDALNTYTTAPLHPWIQSWPTQDLDENTWSDIGSKKALSRPEWTTIEHLLRLYFQYLNPLLPVLKERDLYHLIHPDAHQNDVTSNKPISPALFNAIMFAASSVSPSLSTFCTQILTYCNVSSCLRKMH